MAIGIIACIKIVIIYTKLLSDYIIKIVVHYKHDNQMNGLKYADEVRK